MHKHFTEYVKDKISKYEDSGVNWVFATNSDLLIPIFANQCRRPKTFQTILLNHVTIVLKDSHFIRKKFYQSLEN